MRTIINPALFVWRSVFQNFSIPRGGGLQLIRQSILINYLARRSGFTVQASASRPSVILGFAAALAKIAL
jgi:hypothetical protein